MEEPMEISQKELNGFERKILRRRPKQKVVRLSNIKYEEESDKMNLTPQRKEYLEEVLKQKELYNGKKAPKKPKRAKSTGKESTANRRDEEPEGQS